MQWFFQTNAKSYGLLVIRLALGAVMLPHGLQKALGLFGGPGFEGTVAFMGQIGIPAAIAALVILGESVGAIALLLGFLTRFCAAAILMIMLGAILLVHGQNGFFLPAGYEFAFLIGGAALALMIDGPGAWSVDEMFTKKA